MSKINLLLTEANGNLSDKKKTIILQILKHYFLKVI